MLSQVSPERLRDEWFKILQQPGATDAVLELYRLGLLRTVAPPIAHSESRLHRALGSLRAVERLWTAFKSSRFDAQLLLPETLYALAPQICSRYEAPICDERTFLALLKCAALVHNPAPPLDGPADKEHPAKDQKAQVATELGMRWRCSNREVNLMQTVAQHH